MLVKRAQVTIPALNQRGLQRRFPIDLIDDQTNNQQLPVQYANDDKKKTAVHLWLVETCQGGMSSL